MNPLSNLCGKQFKYLDTKELIQVVNYYIDENRYFNYAIRENAIFNNRAEVIQYFKTFLHSESVLENYFNDWCS